jgi:hypothetical protein
MKWGARLPAFSADGETAVASGIAAASELALVAARKIAIR